MNGHVKLGSKKTPEGELIEAIHNTGCFSPEKIARFARDVNLLRQLSGVLDSHKPEPRKRNNGELIIDLSRRPFVPEGHRVTRHVGSGLLHFTSSCFRYHSKEEVELGSKKDKRINRILAVHKYSLLANANCLDFLLENPDLIPEKFEPWEILFPATRYNGCVRAMYYERWRGCYSWSVVNVRKPLKPNQCIMTIDRHSVMSA